MEFVPGILHPAIPKALCLEVYIKLARCCGVVWEALQNSVERCETLRGLESPALHGAVCAARAGLC
jgi:hypothetical protein